MSEPIEDISAPAVRSEVLTYNRVTTGTVISPRGGYAIRIRYWSTEHAHIKMEQSTQTFPQRQLAEEVAERLAQDIAEKLNQ